MDIYERLEELGIEIPPPSPKGGIYKTVKQMGPVLYLSGQGSRGTGLPETLGKIGSDRTIEEGQLASRTCVIKALSFLHEYLGDLNRIRSVIKMLVFVSSADGFNQQPKVADGASQLLTDIFGPDAGQGARSAIGVNELPGNISVEIEFMFEIKD